MSTIPSRIENIKDVLDNINNQTLKPNKIFLNIPYEYKRFSNQKINDEDLKKIEIENLIIRRCEDYGPGTKIMGSINEIRNFDCVILLDDDHLYDKNICELFLNEFQKKQINYSFYLNKIFNIKMGQCADGFLMNTKLLDKIESFYEKYVKNNKNMFLDDDLWLAIYLQKEKKSSIKNLIYLYREKFGKHVIYTQNSNSKKDGLHLTVHKDGLFLNRRKIQKIEYIKYLIKSLFIKI
tara:strand:+ start:106 stop:816 length:711 start_codon:yes stop_codon:yes gene_type:complete